MARRSKIYQVTDVKNFVPLFHRRIVIQIV